MNYTGNKKLRYAEGGIIMKLSWEEIRKRAYKFSHEWKDETNESAEAKTFWDQFFQVYGMDRRRMANFERFAKRNNGGHGFIDLLWKGVLLIEHKTRGKSLDKAFTQAVDYLPTLRDEELPRYLIISDFDKIRLYDLEAEDQKNYREITLEQLPKNVELFHFIADNKERTTQEQDPVNMKGARKMAELHDKLKDAGYDGHNLEIYLVRLLFNLFADNTNIFNEQQFHNLILNESQEDGKYLGNTLSELFQVLNTAQEKRQRTLDENLRSFPYINGKLFEEPIPIASFDKEMRDLLIDGSSLNWGAISPAIFGTLFQNVMEEKDRRNLGAHYTSEKDILKVIRSLFLDELWKEFDQIKHSKKGLHRFHEKLGQLHFLDPACGCGNFLIVTYRELRMLEIEVIHELVRKDPSNSMTFDISLWAKIDVDQFHGIEIGDFSAQIAKVAMWIIDHQMNERISSEFGEYYVRLPLRKAPNIVHGNALTLDWDKDVVSKDKLNYILGNPPFVGSSNMSDDQKKSLNPILKPVGKAKQMDFVTGWFIKATDFIQGTKMRVGFVATNSIVQGIQAITTWKYLFNNKGIDIQFAHQTFAWQSEARGKANVYCVIIGFMHGEGVNKRLYTYGDIKGDPTEEKIKNINHYLLDAPSVIVDKRSKPLCDVQSMGYGSKPTDDGNYLFTAVEKDDFIQKEPNSARYFKRWIGANEVIYGKERFCLYVKDIPIHELKNMRHVLSCIDKVKEFRKRSTKKQTQEFSNYPKKLGEDRVVEGEVLVIPSVSSEKRHYIPIGYYKDVIVSNLAFQLQNATPYIFGMLNSTMHMAWMRTVSGKHEGRYRYSNTLVYNTFPFPEPTDKQTNEIEKCANAILDARKPYLDEGSTLADLYNILTMPDDLRKAHDKLDNAIDRAYGFKKKNRTDGERVAFLMERYLELVEGDKT